jgi:hypothetical protein
MQGGFPERITRDHGIEAIVSCEVGREWIRCPRGDAGSCVGGGVEARRSVLNLDDRRYADCE